MYRWVCWQRFSFGDAFDSGKTAADGHGRNGIFTAALLTHMARPGQPIEKVLKNVRRDVICETNKRQIPWKSSSLTGDFYFRRSPKPSRSGVEPHAGTDRESPEGWTGW